MTEKLRMIADYDTPAGVDVPAGGKYLMLWAVGRWGGGIVIAAFFCYAYIREADRSRQREDALLEAYLQQAAISAETAEALRANTESIRELTRAAERSHR